MAKKTRRTHSVKLSIDYGLSVDGRITRSRRQRFVCWCGAAGCHGTMFATDTERGHLASGALA